MQKVIGPHLRNFACSLSPPRLKDHQSTRYQPWVVQHDMHDPAAARLVHPPDGINIFVIKSVNEDVKISTTFYGMLILRDAAVHHRRCSAACGPGRFSRHRVMVAFANVKRF